MKLHRFFIEEEIGNRKELEIKTEHLLHQWRNVLRFAVGDKVILFDGKGSDFLCEISALTKNISNLDVLEETKGIIPSKKITLFISLIKRENFELVLEKATELGVSRIVPVIADRSEKKSLNYERALKIVVEASEQSGRTNIPVLGETMTTEEAVDRYKKELSFFAFDPTGSFDYKLTTKSYNLGLLIGPEGGFTPAELEFFTEKEVPIIKLGEQILRAETANIVALSCVMF
ncbi:MAG: RsmE family RNA methyltransferase [Candidatus Paceibacterota bacterium]